MDLLLTAHQYILFLQTIQVLQSQYRWDILVADNIFGSEEMIQTFNFTNMDEELERFRDGEDMRSFAKDHGCDGIELQMIQDPAGSFLEEGLIQGVHLSFWNSWMDLWKGNLQAVLEEFGDLQTVQEYFGGTDWKALLHKIKKELDTAQRLGAKYVVFHVSEVTILQSYTRIYSYSDEEVVDAACEFINCLLDDQNYTFDFLVENLWWPGFDFTRPEITGRLLDGIHYENKGIMLDTGHLMNTNTSLRSQCEAVEYIYQCLEKNKSYLSYIKGVHLNASLSGEYVEQSLKEPDPPTGNYWERWGKIYHHVFRMDQHRPFTDAGVHKLIEYITPKYITHELISISRKELGELIDLQQKAMKQ